MPVLDLPVAMGEFAASRHGAISHSQAASFGLDARSISQLLASQVLRKRAPRVYTLASVPPTWMQDLMVGTLVCNSAGVVGFRSAAALHGVDCFPMSGVSLLLQAPRHLRLEGTEVHVGRLDDFEVTEIDHIRCTTYERSLCDAASICSSFQAKASFECYWRAMGDLTKLRETASRLHRPGQAGTKRILRLLEDASTRGCPTASTLEVQLEDVLAGLEGVVRQHVARDAHGQFLGRPDFAIPHLKLAIEAHSREWHAHPIQLENDLRRHETMTEDGWRIRYVTSGDMKDPALVRADIIRLIRSNEVPSPPSLALFER